MVMHYHLGLGVGHVYSHSKNAIDAGNPSPEPGGEGQPDTYILGDEELEVESASSTGSEVSSSLDDSFDELLDGSEDDDSSKSWSDDEEWCAMEEMYGYSTHGDKG
jgi:hypothetical protein